MEILATTITMAHAGDLAEVAALLREARLPEGDLTPGHMAAFVTAREGAALIGIVGLEVFGRVALLRSFAVRHDRRLHGHGRALLEAAEAAARERGVDELWLLTDTAADYFGRRGYERADRASAPAAMQATTEFREMCPSSATCMRKRL